MINEAQRRGWRIRGPENRPKVDSPTYLRITRRIDEREYQRRLNEERVRIGLPPIKRENSTAG